MSERQGENKLKTLHDKPKKGGEGRKGYLCSFQLNLMDVN